MTLEIDAVIARHNELGKQIVAAGEAMFPKFRWRFDELTKKQAIVWGVTDRIEVSVKWQDFTVTGQPTFLLLEELGIPGFVPVIANRLATEIKGWLLDGKEDEIHTARLEMAKVGWHTLTTSQDFP